ncbi:hypothetical protein V6N13_137099 [Hibiscus sabdariffa]
MCSVHSAQAVYEDAILCWASFSEALPLFRNLSAPFNLHISCHFRWQADDYKMQNAFPWQDDMPKPGQVNQTKHRAPVLPFLLVPEAYEA